MTDLSRLTLGTAPDSWGVWFPEDDHQVSWQQYLDEIAQAGYSWTELGPAGFLPQDPGRLRDELEQRQLKVSGGTVFAGLHRGRDALKEAIDTFSKEARLLQAVGAKYLVHLPEQYTDMHSGAATEAADLEAQQWNDLVNGSNELAKIMLEEFGIELVFHPHVDTHVDTQERVERYLQDTDPQYVNLCLDTGHISYCDGDNVDIIRKFPERVHYVHLKQVDPEVLTTVRAQNLPFSEAVKLGAMVEPPHGIPDMPPLLDALAKLDSDIFTIVEQDLYPVAPHIPLPIGARTAGYFSACGLGPVRRWPYKN
ncbi:sugar phosphate isomerase/epimerase [Hoyosella sp. YIM 151337]|uniref:sugar phosphate isomerase/epimerase n=1 Tax=Hoyosella sp. YIM 151337 TaxID=2992742 RepID=UPI002235C44E|nr:sugar phosphate isomerase/epimerase [Hoyosella sp. YIM 151337]MCW4352448.1 sugar phosphate isomerase/epimerase [Hoyosella sp. YIM 151337]